MGRGGDPWHAGEVTRTVLVTGAARGIGAAVACRLAGDGYRVVAVDRCSDDPALGYPLATRDDLDSVVARCGSTALAAVLDVADREAVLALPGTVGVEAFDAVVCAAGVVWGGPPVWETPESAWTAVHGANVTGVLNTAAATVPQMVARGRGRFVAVASAASERGLARMGAYAASKAAVVSLIRSMAADLADSGVTANAIAPGSVDTDILAASAKVYGLGSVSEFAQHHTDQRLIGPEEIAEAVTWLCSPGSSAVTGAVLAVDAGMTAT